MKNTCKILVLMAMFATGCTGFLDKGPLTAPSGETFLSTENQIFSYVNGLYMALPSLSQYGSGVRAVEKNSDNIISEKYNPRINGELTQFDGQTDWASAYEALRDVNFFFEYYQVSQDHETDDVMSLCGEVYFLRAWWHFTLLKKFGDIPLMNAFLDGHATVGGLQIPATPRDYAARFILSDIDEAIRLLHKREVYSGLRISKEAALILAMNVALYEGTWERYHSSDEFSVSDPQPEWFFRKVMEYGDELFRIMPVSQGLNTLENDPFGAKNGGEAYAHMFNQKDYSAVPEAVFWKKYDMGSGVQHSLTVLLGSGIVDNEAAAGITKSLVDNYLNEDGTFIDPYDPKFKDFNETFSGRDPRLTETVMSSGHKFRSASITRPMKVAAYRYDGTAEAETHNASINPPRFNGDGNGRNLTGYHTALGVDTTYVSSSFWDTGLVLIRYPEALLAYAEAAEELGICTEEVLSKTICALRERAGVAWKKPSADPNFTDYGYPLTPNMQEIRRERRSELALQGFRLDDILRWRGHKVLTGQRGRGAYMGEDGVLFRSFDKNDPVAMEALARIHEDEDGWADPLRDKLPSGYGFRPDRDYLLPVPPGDIALDGELKQNPNW